MKRYKYIVVMLSVSMMLTACGGNASVETVADNINDTDVITADTDGNTVTDMITDTSELFSDRDLSGDYDASACEQITLSDAGSASDSQGVTIDENTITITKEGEYLIEGTLSDGMIIVDVDQSEKVQLILNGVSINSETSAPIYVRQADKVFVTLADGTTNTLTNGGSYIAIDDNNIDAVIFSKDDLTLNGTGSLSISSPAGHGIVSKNDLVITNGTYDITAASHGLCGKDSVAIADGSFVINAGKEGIEGKVVNICGGNIDITAADDGINATDKDADTSGRGMDTQSDASINISGGIVKINAEGDGIDSNGYLTVSGGEVYVAGPSNSGNAALDYGIDATITGGIVVAAGQSGMSQSFGTNSTQGCILVNTQQQNEAGSSITLLDSGGKELLAWNVEKSYNSVIVSCPGIVDGGKYTLKTGETTTEVTMEGLLYGSGSNFGGGMHGGGGKMDGQRPDRTKTEDMPKMPDGAQPDGMKETPQMPDGAQPDGMKEPPEIPDGAQPEGL